jgi:hypothetical protein
MQSIKTAHGLRSLMASRHGDKKALEKENDGDQGNTRN